MKKLKSILATIFMLSLVLPAFGQTVSECEEYLKMVATELNSQCPMDYGNNIAMTSVTYSGKTLGIHMNMPIIDESQYSSVSGTFRDSFLGGLFGTDGGEFIYEWMNKAGAKMNIIFRLKDGSQKTMTFTAGDLRKYMQTH